MRIEGDTLTFIGDLHLNSATPRSRLDDYSQTSLYKLEQIRDIAITKGYKHLVLLGDIFHKNQQPISYLNQVLLAFKDWHRSGLKVYAIVGNHDISHERMDQLRKSALDTLFTSEFLTPLDRLDLHTSAGNQVTVKGFHYTQAIEPASVYEDLAETSICVAHRFYQYQHSDASLSSEQVEKLGYTFYLLGHDHVPYDPVKVGSSYVVRPGSITRGTSHQYNLDRGVQIVTLRFGGLLGDPKISMVKDALKVKPAEEVFSSVVFGTREKQETMDSMTRKVEELLEKMDQVSKGTSVYGVLDGLELDPKVKARIQLYLEQAGVYRQEDPVA